MTKRVKNAGKPATTATNVDHVSAIASLLASADTTTGEAFAHWACQYLVEVAADTTGGKWRKPRSEAIAKTLGISDHSVRKYFSIAGRLMTPNDKAHVEGLKDAAAVGAMSAASVMARAFEVETLRYSDVTAWIELHKTGNAGGNDTPLADRMIRNLKSSDATLADVMTMLAIGKVKGSKVLGPKDDGSSLLSAVVRACTDKDSQKGFSKALKAGIAASMAKKG